MAKRPDPPHLRIDRLNLEFGGVRAINDVSIDLSEGGICGLIGPNGAGKTSLLNCVSGFYAPTSGDVTLDGRSLLRMRRHKLVGRGIARTFQNLALFPEMSVFDNVSVGASRSRGTDRADVWAMLDRFGLVEHGRHPARDLPFGTLKRVEFARALMSQPRLLLLDEPAGGLTHSEVDELGELIREAARGTAPAASMLGPASGPSVLLVEHHMGLILSVCERIVVLDSGRKIADGPTDQVRDDPAVINAYLGGVPILLHIDNLCAGYGAADVIRSVSLDVADGEIAVVLGANGAGKTTLLRAITGVLHRTGVAEFDGTPLRSRPEDNVRAGLSLVPQGRGTLTELTVVENLLVGAAARKPGRAVDEDVTKWCEFFPVLGERREQKAGSLSGGEQQMLAIARALMARPRLVLLDEPSLGLAPIIVQRVFAALTDINSTEGTSMLIVEQNADLALRAANSAYVLEAGHVVASGSAAEFLDDDRVRNAYLGGR